MSSLVGHVLPRSGILALVIPTFFVTFPPFLQLTRFHLWLATVLLGIRAQG